MEPLTDTRPIHCARCNMPTGAVLISGDPYLPLIYCVSCAERTDDDG
jgi:hypothetical protein